MAKSLSNLGKMAKFKADKVVRKAGERMRKFDDNYSKAIADMYIEDGKRYGDIEGAARSLGAGFLGGMPVSSYSEAAAPVITSTAVRYGAPLAGAGLALKGAYDIAVSLGSGEQTPGTVMP